MVRRGTGALDFARAGPVRSAPLPLPHTPTIVGKQFLPRGLRVVAVAGFVPARLPPSADATCLGPINRARLLVKHARHGEEAVPFLGGDGGDGVDAAAEQLVGPALRVHAAVGRRGHDVAALALGLDEDLPIVALMLLLIWALGALGEPGRARCVGGAEEDVIAATGCAFEVAA